MLLLLRPQTYICNVYIEQKSVLEEQQPPQQQPPQQQPCVLPLPALPCPPALPPCPPCPALPGGPSRPSGACTETLSPGVGVAESGSVIAQTSDVGTIGLARGGRRGFPPLSPGKVEGCGGVWCCCCCWTNNEYREPSTLLGFHSGLCNSC